ncbi:MAG: hypothetical protein R3C09_15515 [Pirellulaceae bacterium]
MTGTSFAFAGIFLIRGCRKVPLLLMPAPHPPPGSSGSFGDAVSEIVESGSRSASLALPGSSAQPRRNRCYNKSLLPVGQTGEAADKIIDRSWQRQSR